MTSDPAVAEPLEYNPFDPAVHRDPYPLYERLRLEDPVHWNLPGLWILTRYADATAMLRDPGMSSDYRNSDLYEAFRQMSGEAGFEERTPSLLFRDPPDHTRLRNLVSRAFTAKVIDGLRPRIRAVVDELLDAVEDARGMDVVADLAHPLPVVVICEMLGVPAEDRERFAQWSADLVHTLDPMVGPDVIERANASAIAFDAYFIGLIAERRAQPKDDLLTALIAAEEEGDQLTQEELLTTLVLLLVAGHETTVNLISNGVLALMGHRDQLQRLRADPSLIRSGVEELLRFDAPVQLTGRIALRDMEIGGRAIRKGQQVVGLVGAANRDPAQFPEPDSLDLGRTDNRHMAFGGGIHFCLGAALARAEGQTAIGALVARHPDIEPAGEPSWRETITLRGLSALPVAW